VCPFWASGNTKSLGKIEDLCGLLSPADNGLSLSVKHTRLQQKKLMQGAG
jgi:hypothetical protein